MVTIGDDLDADRAARALGKLFGRVGGARLLVASDIERGAGHLRREREHIGRVLQPIDEALRGDHVPPAGHQHELLAASGGDESAGLRGLESTAHRSAAVAGAEDVVSAAVEREGGEAEIREHRRLETRRAGVEVHRVAVEEQYSSGGGTPVGLVVGSIEGFGVGRDGNEFRQQLHVVTPLNEIKIDIFGFLQNVLHDSTARSACTSRIELFRRSKLPGRYLKKFFLHSSAAQRI